MTSSRFLVVLVAITILVITLCVPSIDARKHGGKSNDHDSDRATDSSGIPLFGPGQSIREMYLQHVQCRRCVTPLNTTSMSAKEMKRLRHYPTEPMIWCATDFASDYHGSCVAATATPTDAPSSAKINSAACNGHEAVTAANMCANDDPATKPSCTTCVLDGYTWTPNSNARAHKDEYDGVCSDAVATSSDMTHLRQCVNLVYNIRGMKDAAHSASWFVGVIGIVAVVAALCCCLRCCARLRAARLAKLNAANAQSSVVHYHMPPPLPPAVGQTPYNYMPTPPPPPPPHAYPAQAHAQSSAPAPQVYMPPQHTSQPQLHSSPVTVARPVAPSLYPIMGARNPYSYNGIQ